MAHFFVFWAQFSQNVGIFGPILSSHAPNDGKICALCMIRGPVQRKVPLPGKIFARCILQRRFAGLFGCMARISCQSQLISDAWRANLAANWRFSRPRPLSGCMERKNCHGLPPGNAPRRNLATARPLGTHRARILPLPVRPRVHQGAILPPSDAGGDAPRENIATTSRPRTHFAHILPSPGAWECIASISCHRQTSENVQFRHTSTASRPVAQRSPREGMGSVPWLCCGVRRATLSVRGSGHSAFSGLNCWERLRVCAVSVGNHEPASRSAKLCRIMC